MPRFLAAHVPPLRVLPRYAVLGLILASVSPAASAQSGEALQDWPCVQRLVPEVMTVTFWPEPVEPAARDGWRDDAEVRALAQRLGDGEGLDPADEAALDALVRATPADERRARLGLLAEGTVQVVNERRSSYIDGIRRYTRQQIALSERIESTLNELAERDDTDRAVMNAPGDAPADDVQQTLAWNERLYDQREHSIRALCEQPVKLEERLAEVMRALAQRLPES